jgi:hypothetical protein
VEVQLADDPATRSTTSGRPPSEIGRYPAALAWSRPFRTADIKRCFLVRVIQNCLPFAFLN